jgi:hypothetical protein
MERLTHEPAVFASAECYEAAFLTLQAEVWDGKKLHRSDWELVNGVLNDTRGRFGHAWLQNGETVYDPLTRQYADRATYYLLNGVEHAVRYTFPVAFKLMEKYRRYGGWDEAVAAAGHLPRPGQSAGSTPDPDHMGGSTGDKAEADRQGESAGGA